MKIKDIQWAARNNRENDEFPVLRGPFASAEHCLVEQYEAIVGNRLWSAGQDYFKIARNFLNELTMLYPDNVTLKCLNIMNDNAFRKPTKKEYAYLTEHSAAQAKFGLNLNIIIREQWENRTFPEVLALEEANLTKPEVTVDDISHMRAQFERVRAAPHRVDQKIKEFVAACVKQKIAVPKYDTL